MPPTAGRRRSKLWITDDQRNQPPIGAGRIMETNNNPGPRASHDMVYDRARGVVVLYGGARKNFETWEFDGADWALKDTDGPQPARMTQVMEYDSARGVVVMFGGITPSDSNLQDTWEWDGSAWKEVATPIAPDSRGTQASMYDSKRQQILLMGGRKGNSNKTFNDTWTYGRAPD